MYKEMLKRLVSQLGVKVEVKTMVCQALLWPGYYEYRLYCGGDVVYSVLFDEDENQVTDFCLVPVKEPVK